MKILLHIGMHKTGSSFLQMMISKNREYLIENKIFYPIGERDKDALEGRISPGNAYLLSRAILNGNRVEFFNYILTWLNDAQKNGCDKLLLSSEGLFHSLASTEYSELFRELKSRTKITEINSLIFLRDPFDHILSLYKHRGKGGNIGNFRYWVENDYETLQLMERLIGKEKGGHIKFTFRKYKKDADYMAKSLFYDWLKIKTPQIPIKNEVNTSLTLSEILVLTELRKVDKISTIRKLKAELLKIEIMNKARDTNLKNFYRIQIDDWFTKNENIICAINNLLPCGEKLTIYIPDKSDQAAENITLNREQFSKVVLSRIIDNGLFSKILKRIIFKWKTKK